MVAKKWELEKPTAAETQPDGMMDAQRRAIVANSASFISACTSEPFVEDVWPGLDMVEMSAIIRKSMGQVRDGDMSSMEDMLVGQAHALQQVFLSLMRRASIQEHLKQYNTFMTMGFKAQAQCRATIQALTELKYPRQVVIAKQANIASGHQQVNNGVGQNAAPAPAAEKVIEQNELLEHSHANTLPQRLDTRAPQAASRENPAMATLDTLDGSQDAGR